VKPFLEFPKMLHHPETGVDATARNKAEQTALEAQGFVAPMSDPAAFMDVQAMPYRPGEVAEEWPKWVDGKLVDPRPVPPTWHEYPKALTPPAGGDQVIVQTEAEERTWLERWTGPVADAEGPDAADADAPRFVGRKKAS